jgi:hypothetical protein
MSVRACLHTIQTRGFRARAVLLGRKKNVDKSSSQKQRRPYEPVYDYEPPIMAELGITWDDLLEADGGEFHEVCNKSIRAAKRYFEEKKAREKAHGKDPKRKAT